MSRIGWITCVLSVTVAAAFAASRFAQPDPVWEPPVAINAVESPGMCPWRNPAADMRAFFPGSDRSVQHLLILSDLTTQILRRLGPGSRIDANGIYCYRIYIGAHQVGVVLCQRTPGEFGVVEYSLGIDRFGRIAGLRIQRLREPDSTQKAIESRAWLGAFAGKSSESNFMLGDGVPDVGAAASQTAGSIADSVRRLTVEYDVALEHGR